MALVPSQVAFINLCDQTYHTYGNMPSLQKAALELNLTVETIKSYLKDEQVQTALFTRGIDYSHSGTNAFKSHALLTTEQILVANAMLNLNDKRSNRQKLEDYGISTQQFQSWYSQPAFADYMRARAEKAFGSGDADAYLALLALVQQQDLQAVKLFMEIRGIYNPKVTHQLDVPKVVTALIEAVQRHIAPLPNGSEILAAIAEEIDALDVLPAGPRPGQTLSNSPSRALPSITPDHTNHDPIVSERAPDTPLSSDTESFFL